MCNVKPAQAKNWVVAVNCDIQILLSVFAKYKKSLPYLKSEKKVEMYSDYFVFSIVRAHEN